MMWCGMMWYDVLWFCGFVVLWDDRIVLCSVVWLRFVFFSLSVLATQVFAREKVCRCTSHILRP